MAGGTATVVLFTLAVLLLAEVTHTAAVTLVCLAGLALGTCVTLAGTPVRRTRRAPGPGRPLVRTAGAERSLSESSSVR
jgi:hypothetical protein